MTYIKWKYKKEATHLTKEEFEELVNDYEKDIYTLCLRLCSSKEEAEDLLQDVFLDVLKNMANINKKKIQKVIY